MKFTWEEADVVCGRLVCKASQTDCEPCGNSAKWTHKIGWLGAGRKTSDHYVLIAMTDGMVSDQKSLAQMVETLNKGPYAPMPHIQFIKTMEYLRDAFNELPWCSKRRKP